VGRHPVAVADDVAQNMVDDNIKRRMLFVY